MREQFNHFWNNWQAYWPMVQANSAIIVAIILLFVIWALKSQILRQNRRFLRELKQEWQKQNAKNPTAAPAANAVKASLIEHKVMIYQDFVNLKAERMVEQQQAGENGLSAKRYYDYFKAFRDLVVGNRFYVGQESEFIFNQLMQDNAAALLKLKQLENEFAQLTSETPSDRYALEQLTEQEAMALETFYQESRAEMERFLELIENDILKLRADIDA